MQTVEGFRLWSREFFDNHWLGLRGRIAQIKAETRSHRQKGFREYFARLEAEEHIIFRAQSEFLELLWSGFACHSKLRAEDLAQTQQDFRAELEEILLASGFGSKTRFMLEQIGTVSDEQLQAYFDFKLSMYEKLKASPAARLATHRRVFARMIEDACFDRFSLEEDVVNEIGSHYLRNGSRFAELVSFFELNQLTGLYPKRQRPLTSSCRLLSSRASAG